MIRRPINTNEEDEGPEKKKRSIAKHKQQRLHEHVDCFCAKETARKGENQPGDDTEGETRVQDI